MIGIIKILLIFSTIINFSLITATPVYGSAGLELGNVEHSGNLGQFHRGPIGPGGFQLQQEHHIGLPFVPNVQHQTPFTQQPIQSQLDYNPNQHDNQQIANNNLNDNNNKGQLIFSDNNEHKNSIVINANKPDTPALPIIINHGRGHLKHLSDIIIHDQKCGSPTRIKETSHGLFGLFHKSHIIIIGKDCKDDYRNMMPIFAPKLTAPIHLHQQQSTHSYKQFNNDVDYEDISDLGHWSGGDQHQPHSSIQHTTFKSPVTFKSYVKTPVSTSVNTVLSPDHLTLDQSDVSHGYGPGRRPNVLSESKATTLRGHLWQ